MISKISKRFVDKKIILIDCFDTLLFRIINSDEVIDSWLIKVGQEYSVNYFSLKAIWKKCNQIRNRYEEASFIEKCKEFYKRILILNSNIGSFAVFYDNVFAFMLDIEVEATVVNQELISELQMAQHRGIRIFCVTDFYMPKNFMVLLFENKNIKELFEEIYVSSEIGLRKSTGSLYEYVCNAILKENNILRSDIIMIGDNKKSDYKNSINKGIQAIHYKKKGIVSDEIKRILLPIEKIYNDNCRDYPFVTYAFSIYLFCENLYQELKAQQEDKVYFFSREGQYLKIYFEKFLEFKNESKIKTKYLYVSRQSTYLASLKKLEIEEFHVLKKQVSSLSLYTFLKNIDLCELSNDDYLQQKYDFGIEIDDFFKSKTFQVFLDEPIFYENYEKKRVVAKKNIITYFREQGIHTELKRVSIVDIGWKGSIQDNIYNIFDGKLSINGYYFGLIGDIDTEKCNWKKGLIFSDYPFETKYFKIYKTNYRMLEELFYADHGSCLYYRDGEPVLDEVEDYEKELYLYIVPMQKRMLHIFEEVFLLRERNKFLNDNLFEKVLAYLHGKFILSIDKRRIEQMAYMSSRLKNNFGNFSKKTNLSKKQWAIEYLQSIKNNPIEIIQKVLILLNKIKMGFFAKIVTWISVYIFRNKFLYSFK